MKSLICCEYKVNLEQSNDEFHFDKIKIIQIVSDTGEVTIGSISYPITFGGLYFVNARQNFFNTTR